VDLEQALAADGADGEKSLGAVEAEARPLAPRDDEERQLPRVTRLLAAPAIRIELGNVLFGAWQWGDSVRVWQRILAVALHVELCQLFKVERTQLLHETLLIRLVELVPAGQDVLLPKLLQTLVEVVRNGAHGRFA
jgi:hypothetical protein